MMTSANSRPPKRNHLPVVIPEQIGKLCESRVFPVLQARGIDCCQDGQSWLSSLLQSDDLWAWVAQVRVPNPGEVFDVEIPRHGSPKIHDATVQLDKRVASNAETIRLEAIRVVGSHVYCRLTSAEPCQGPPVLAELLMLSNRLLTLTATPAPDRPIFIGDTIFANELTPMTLLVQRPARLIQAAQMGITTYLVLRGERGFGTPCETCNATGQVPCTTCGGSGRVTCSRKKCGGSGSFTGNYGEHIVCDRCSGTGQMECYRCHGQCNSNCHDCYKHSGYRLVWWDDRTGRFDIVEFEDNQTGERSEIRRIELGQQSVVLVEWGQGEPISLESNSSKFLHDLLEDASGTAALSEQKAMRLADHARRLSLFEPILQYLIEKEKRKVVHDKPVAFRGIDASAERLAGRVVYEFLLDRPKGAWVKERINPFPRGTRVLFVPQPNSSRREAAPLRWVEGFEPGPGGGKLQASFLRVKESTRGLRFLISFPEAVDKRSIPVSGFVLADQPPPAEEAQLKCLRAWCGPYSRMHPVFQAVVFMDAPDSRLRRIKLHNQSIRETQSQLEAVRLGCGEAPLALVKGPPGTGKTTVIVEIIRQLAAQNRKVLLCSQTHQAVRNVLERLDGEKRIRMSRHRSGSDDSLSDLERKYLAGAVADTFEKDTLERARGAYRAAQKRWKTEGAQLRAFEAGRDAAAELALARQRLPEQHGKVDVAADKCLGVFATAAEKLRGEYRKQHDTKGQKLRQSLKTLEQEREWASAMIGSLVQRMQRLGDEGTELPAPSSTVDAKADIDASPATVELRHRELCLQAKCHDIRNQTLGAGAESLEAELRKLDERKEAKVAQAETRASLMMDAIQTAEDEGVLAKKEEAVQKRQDLETRHAQQLREISQRFKGGKASARAKITGKKGTLKRVEAELTRTTGRKKKVAEQYASIVGKHPRMGEVPDRSWLRRKLPAKWAGEEELRARYSVLRREEKELQGKRREFRSALVALQEALEAVLREEAKETADVQRGLADEHGRIDQEEHRGLTVIRDRSEAKRGRALASREKKVQAAVSDWESARGHKPDTLDALRQEAGLESRILDLSRAELTRLESYLANHSRSLESIENESPTAEEAVPDGQAEPNERARRIEGCRRDVVLLRSRVEYCQLAETARDSDIRANDGQLTEHLEKVDLDLQRNVEGEEEKRRNGHAAVQIAFEATERRCQERQTESLVFADSSMSNDEPPDRWESLAVPIRPAGLRLKEEFEFLQRWVQDLEANLGAVRKLHWDNIDVFLSTCVGVASWRQLIAGGRDAVDTVIIDEAAHATVPETLIPMLYGKRCILIGDEMQLPPLSMEDDLPPMPREDWISDSEIVAGEKSPRVDPGTVTTRIPLAENWLERTFFEWLYLYRSGLPRQMLDKQFRMHPDIAGFVADVFYPEGLHNGVTENDRRLTFGEYTEAVYLIPTDSDEGRFQVKVGDKKGYRNPREADIVLQILQQAEKYLDLEGYRDDLVAGIKKKAAETLEVWSEKKTAATIAEAMSQKPSFGVITPYAQQKELILRHLKRALPSFRNLDISAGDDVGSVDSYQGSERDVIIISFVRSPKKEPAPCPKCQGTGDLGTRPCRTCRGYGWKGEDLRFVRDLRRLNVAFSRAKRMLILVGDFHALVNPHHHGNEEGGRVLDAMRQYVREHVVEIPEIEGGYGR